VHGVRFPQHGALRPSDCRHTHGRHAFTCRVRSCAVAAAFLEPEKYRDTVIAIYDEILSCDQMVETFTEVTGIKARCPPDSAASLPSSAALASVSAEQGPHDLVPCANSCTC